MERPTPTARASAEDQAPEQGPESPEGAESSEGMEGMEGMAASATLHCLTGCATGEIVALERGDLKWRMAVPPDGHLPFDGCFPALIQWDSPTPPGETLPSSGCTLESLTVAHPEADRLHQRLAPYLMDARVQFQPGSAHLEARLTGPAGPVTLR